MGDDILNRSAAHKPGCFDMKILKFLEKRIKKAVMPVAAVGHDERKTRIAFEQREDFLPTHDFRVQNQRKASRIQCRQQLSGAPIRQRKAMMSPAGIHPGSLDSPGFHLAQQLTGRRHLFGVMGKDDPDGVESLAALNVLHEQGVAERRIGVASRGMINESFFDARGRHFLLKPRRIKNIEKERISGSPDRAVAVKEAEFHGHVPAIFFLLAD
jgi:hypothetical protein